MQFRRGDNRFAGHQVSVHVAHGVSSLADPANVVAAGNVCFKLKVNRRSRSTDLLAQLFAILQGRNYVFRKRTILALARLCLSGLADGQHLLIDNPSKEWELRSYLLPSADVNNNGNYVFVVAVRISITLNSVTLVGQFDVCGIYEIAKRASRLFLTQLCSWRLPTGHKRWKSGPDHLSLRLLEFPLICLRTQDLLLQESGHIMVGSYRKGTGGRRHRPPEGNRIADLRNSIPAVILLCVDCQKRFYVNRRMDAELRI